MGSANEQLRLLAHFDGLSDADEVSANANYPLPKREGPVQRVRGIGWVLKWSGALGVLFVAGGMLIQFAYCLAAEQALTRAARAGVLEATLPRASSASVRRVVEQRLAAYPSLAGRLQLHMLQNGGPTLRDFRVADG